MHLKFSHDRNIHTSALAILRGEAQSGLSADHVAMIGTLRCGPQTELPDTYAN